MAKDIIILTWCDKHMSDDEKVEAKERGPIMLDGRTVTIDLCDVCFKAYVTPLAELLDEYGAMPAYTPRSTGALIKRPGAKKTVERGAQCVWCDMDYSATSSSGYMRHIKVVHGFASAQEAFGTICPICGQGEVFQMMGHIKNHHPEYDLHHTAQAMYWAKDHGDPYGVYAASLNRKPSLNPEEAQKTVRAQEKAKPSKARR